jgi:acetyl/propionyl-CoA carboxylase alpha subunit
MQAAGVPVIPGTGTDLRDEEIWRQASQVGFPLFVKAVAGGGGKGMRRVADQGELARTLDSARREAANAFGDDRLYLERAIEDARHIEVQILADGRGGVIHLGERDCSIQRRHQKLVEESPSPAVDDDLRQRIAAVAVRAAQAVNYSNAGTVEFLLDSDGAFYFLEMNTRLQVEHPITESVTGIDIVKEQVRIAAGGGLPVTQDQIQSRGSALECRITAEDPLSGFLPSSGRVIRLFQPSGPGVRVDSGLYEGLEVSLYYDPLLAKLITWGGSRQEAIQRMRGALREFRVVGIHTSIPFHRWLMDDDDFGRGVYDTGLVGQRFLAEPPSEGDRSMLAAVVGTILSHEQRQRRHLAPAAPCDDASQQDAWRRATGSTSHAWKLTGRREATWG